MKFRIIDRIVRVGLLATIAGVVAFTLAGVAGRGRDPIAMGVNRKPLVIVSGQTEQIPDADAVSSPGGAVFNPGNVAIGLNTPLHQLQIDSTAACTGNIPDSACMPVAITEFAAAAPSIAFRRALGTQGAPTTLTALGDFIGQLRFQPYTTTGFQGLPQVELEVANAEAGSPTATAQGNYLQLRTVPIGGTSSVPGLKVDSTQYVAVGDTTFNTTSVPFGLTQSGSMGYIAAIQPAPIVGGTVNDYAPTDTLSARTLANAYFIRQFCSGSVTITGIAGGPGTTNIGSLGGRTIVFTNTGTTGTCSFTNEGGGSSAGDRITLPDAVTMVVPPGGSVYFFYDIIATRWRPTAVSSASGILRSVDGAVATPSILVGTHNNAGIYNNGNGVAISNLGFDIISTSIVGTTLSGFTQHAGSTGTTGSTTLGFSGAKAVTADLLSAAPAVNHGSLSADASNFMGTISGIGANTSVTLTFGGAGFTTRSHCFIQVLSGAYASEGYVVVVTSSKTAPVFSCKSTATTAPVAANCPDLDYQCWGN